MTDDARWSSELRMFRPGGEPHWHGRWLDGRGPAAHFQLAELFFQRRIVQTTLASSGKNTGGHGDCGGSYDRGSQEKQQ